MVKRIEPGIRYGKLVTTGNYIPGSQKPFINSKAECKCDCGTTKYVACRSLKKGVSKTCGCEIGNKTHGYTIGKKITKEYTSWRAMKQRCNYTKDKYYKYYGGRGIKVCEEFSSFLVFLEHVGLAPTPEHSIDRIDNERGYEIGNVRWATHTEQMKNRRPWKKKEKINDIL